MLEFEFKNVKSYAAFSHLYIILGKQLKTSYAETDISREKNWLKPYRVNSHFPLQTSILNEKQNNSYWDIFQYISMARGMCLLRFELPLPQKKLGSPLAPFPP